jgi:hypothetical protein
MKVQYPTLLFLVDGTTVRAGSVVPNTFMIMTEKRHFRRNLFSAVLVKIDFIHYLNKAD